MKNINCKYCDNKFGKCLHPKKEGKFLFIFKYHPICIENETYPFYKKCKLKEEYERLKATVFPIPSKTGVKEGNLK